MAEPIPGSDLAAMLESAHRRTLHLVRGVRPDQLPGPRLPNVNPLPWEIGHVAWFHEKWVLRHLYGRHPLRADADALYDSIALPHDARWDLRLPPLAETLDYLERVFEALRDRLAEKDLAAQDEAYFYRLTIFHEDMHDESLTYSRQALAWPRPDFGWAEAQGDVIGEGPLPGDVYVPGGTFLLGAGPDEPFVFDNEKWAHPVELAPFRIAKAPVTNAEYLGFVADGGYERREFWSEQGWQWRGKTQARHPVYWQRDGGEWLQRRFDAWLPLRPHAPVVHITWYEADAYCRWAGRRLPTEAEWEAAAAGQPTPDGDALRLHKRRFPWGNEPPTPRHANLAGWATDYADVAAYPDGDSVFGCRQMIGNVWEWTASNFEPYPGFTPDPYQEYSAPWFGPRKVLRGGCWATQGWLLRNTWRNFFLPERNDVFAGFRTCAL